MEGSGNRSILDMEGFNLIDFSTEDDSLIDLLLLEPRTPLSSGVLKSEESSSMIGTGELLFPGMREDANRSCDSSKMVESETSTSGTCQGEELFEDIRASTRESGQGLNVEGSPTEKKLRMKSPNSSEGSMSLVHKPPKGLNTRTTISAIPAKRASLGSKNVKMKKSVKSAGGIAAPVLKTRASSGLKNIAPSSAPASETSGSPSLKKKEPKAAFSSLESGSATSEKLRCPLDSSKGKGYLNRSNTASSHLTAKTLPKVASRSRNPTQNSQLSADKKQVRSSLSTHKESLPSQFVGGLPNTAPRGTGSDQGKIRQLKVAAPCTSINGNKAVKLASARSKSGTFAIPNAKKEVSVAPRNRRSMDGLSTGVGKSLLPKSGGEMHSKDKQIIGRRSCNSSSSGLVKKNGSSNFQNKGVRTKRAGGRPLKVSKVTPLNVGSTAENMFHIASEDETRQGHDLKINMHSFEITTEEKETQRKEKS